VQAAAASDYAIHQFSHLQRLLAVHGRYSLLRNASLIQFSVYKNVAFFMPQVWFAFFAALSGQVTFPPRERSHASV
jgi:P-type E1-E2 ATPase